MATRHRGDFALLPLRIARRWPAPRRFHCAHQFSPSQILPAATGETPIIAPNGFRFHILLAPPPDSILEIVRVTSTRMESLVDPALSA